MVQRGGWGIPDRIAHPSKRGMCLRRGHIRMHFHHTDLCIQVAGSSSLDML